jgi:lysylphosphatidylglycerol synthetase-like protein (DUF2156 family)
MIRDNTEIDLEARIRLFRQFGNFTIAWSTVVQPGLKYFGHAGGYLAYASKWGIDFVLGDPVIEASAAGEIVDRFIASCRRKPCFVNCSGTTARELERQGYYINPMGIDTIIDLPTYDFSGKSKEPFRYAANWLARRGYRIEERDYSELDPRIALGLSEKWRGTRTVKDREVGLLNRPFVAEDEPGVRKFFLFDERRELVAMVYLDPVYEDGGTIGYSTSIKRRLPDAPVCAEQGIMKHCVEKLKTEGIGDVRLGLSPLCELDHRTFQRRNPFLQFSFSAGFRAKWLNRWFYNVQGHAAFKKRFRGREEPVYFATPVLINDFRIIAMLRLMNVF